MVSRRGFFTALAAQVGIGGGSGSRGSRLRESGLVRLGNSYEVLLPGQEAVAPICASFFRQGIPEPQKQNCWWFAATEQDGDLVFELKANYGGVTKTISQTVTPLT